MKISCLIIDDEPPALELLHSHISNISDIEIIAACKNAVEAFEILNSQKVDLIFLDIKMPKLLGTDFLKNLANPPKVIFVTAYREYALDGYELDAVDYLVKPVTFDRFLKAVYKAKRLIGQENLPSTNEYGKNREAFIYVRVNKNMQKIFLDQIIYIESWKDYVKIFLINDKYFLAKLSISAMQNMLSAQSFLRVHRSFMVSMDKVTGFNSNCIFIGEKEVPIGRLYKQEVMKMISAK